MEYLGQRIVPHRAKFAGTVIGGLSSISYDPGRHIYYAISDDRSVLSPARFYTVRIPLTENGFGEPKFVGVHLLRDRSGRTLAPSNIDAEPPVIAPDPEGIAFDRRRQRLYWSSEGSRLQSNRRGSAPVALDPWIWVASLDGCFLGEFDLPPGLSMSTSPGIGPRRNLTLEGLTVSPSGQFLFAAMEGPGYADGDPPNHKHGALTRITQFDIETKTPVAEWAYQLEPATPPAETNGLSGLVALSDSSFLVIERAGVDKPGKQITVRLYRAEIGEATQVLARPSFVADPPTPISKSLVADLNAIPRLTPLDNIEGITLGPILPDGRQSVILVSDDNFLAHQVTQFLMFAL
ncbi:esterase-like activity of phytase family protein [Mycobacterium montefiorense]|uniref:Phytase n=1 Tax=Mycobacterium montefiorense TaxID=154654 RepID=A0AA37PNQ2_9MYCO|nr:esterase-like activity of phytase family protein [Mycobacterium montefiorense]GKU42523.1 phytase [Mycobacterium montefiorense]GKU46311.1 phytase [Mycobacterium montefiorense]GKU55129.1 phytase [Mycobacterium montefiorense]GKU72910.1 phytase [Mycobacterium montefiorense]